MWLVKTCLDWFNIEYEFYCNITSKAPLPFQNGAQFLSLICYFSRFQKISAERLRTVYDSVKNLQLSLLRIFIRTFVKFDFEIDQFNRINWLIETNTVVSP